MVRSSRWQQSVDCVETLSKLSRSCSRFRGWIRFRFNARRAVIIDDMFSLLEQDSPHRRIESLSLRSGAADAYRQRRVTAAASDPNLLANAIGTRKKGVLLRRARSTGDSLEIWDPVPASSGRA